MPTTPPLAPRLTAIKPRVIEWRRHLHRHPERSGAEARTAAFVADTLRETGITVETGIGGHGVVGRLENGSDRPAVAFRADMDALPLTDAKEVPWASTVPGVMHACGHDGHTAVLLGLAAALEPIAATLPRPVQFIFQPAEEIGQGAQAMLADGIFARQPPAAIHGFHFFPSLVTGAAALADGAFMAATDTFRITVSGRASHACYPEEGVDAIQIAAAVIAAGNLVINKMRDPAKPALISFGMVEAGTAANIIAATAILTGTIRTLDSEQRRLIHRRFRKLITDLAAAHGGSAEMELTEVAPALVNDPTLSERTAAIIRKAVPSLTTLLRRVEPVMGGEDFSYFAARVPGCYIKIGCRNEARGIVHPLHSDRFDIDDDALGIALEMLGAIATNADRE
ncbi:MAG: amidohydrolase [Deltaproteobacteria bacterium]|nr:amidohydrolase [Candidatus Anaeroferrophillacea bacterium]